MVCQTFQNTFSHFHYHFIPKKMKNKARYINDARRKERECQWYEHYIVTQMILLRLNIKHNMVVGFIHSVTIRVDLNERTGDRHTHWLWFSQNYFDSHTSWFSYVQWFFLASSTSKEWRRVRKDDFYLFYRTDET